MMTMGQVALHFSEKYGDDVPAWKIRRLFERKLLPAAMRVGCYRVIDVRDLSKVEAALEEAGYLPQRVTA
jgi:hypothetical protein